MELVRACEARSSEMCWEGCAGSEFREREWEVEGGEDRRRMGGAGSEEEGRGEGLVVPF